MGAVGGLALALLLVGVGLASCPSRTPAAGGRRTAGGTRSVRDGRRDDQRSTRPPRSTTNGSVPNSQPPPSRARSHSCDSRPARRRFSLRPRRLASSAGASSAAVSNSVAGAEQPSSRPAGSRRLAQAQAQQEPSSLLAVLPGEGVGKLIATVSPLLIGLLVAALVYGAYARRQDASS